MFGWLNKNPTKDLTVRRNNRLAVDLDRGTFNGIPAIPCNAADLSSLGKATGFKKYATGHKLSYRESGVDACLHDGQLDALYFNTAPGSSPGMSTCRVTVIFQGRQVVIGQNTTANELIEFLGDPFVAVESNQEIYDVEWHGEGWILSCEFDRNAGLNFFDVTFSARGG